MNSMDFKGNVFGDGPLNDVFAETTIATGIGHKIFAVRGGISQEFIAFRDCANDCEIVMLSTSGA
jgi:hypothetical protein